jgi:hypothetical protein
VLQKQIRTDKVFLYMVIHDLKHPTDSIISQLSSIQANMEAHLDRLDSLQKGGAEIQNLLKSHMETGNLGLR